jgi:galactokinase
MTLELEIQHRAEKQACATFRQLFQRAPSWMTSAPGRVNLIGEFTDFNGGFVLPMAIEPRIAIAAASNDSNDIVLHSETQSETVTIDLSRPLMPDHRGRWSNYPKGVLAEFLELGIEPRGFDAVICSTVPVGAGLSSSAALETATALLLQRIWEAAIDPLRTALLCQRAEHRYAQVPCGLMDQFICLMGRPNEVLFLDCRSYDPVWIPWADPDVTILVVNTGVRHELSSTEYAVRRQSCEVAARSMGVASLREAEADLLNSHVQSMDDLAARCARHVIAENHRARQAATYLYQSDWNSVGRLMYESHDSLRDDYQVSCRELDLLVDAARDIGNAGGVLGARMTGGGFGGCVILLIRCAMESQIMTQLDTAYRQQVGLEATMFASRPCVGATSVDL